VPGLPCASGGSNSNTQSDWDARLRADRTTMNPRARNKMPTPTRSQNHQDMSPPHAAGPHAGVRHAAPVLRVKPRTTSPPLSNMTRGAESGTVGRRSPCFRRGPAEQLCRHRQVLRLNAALADPRGEPFLSTPGEGSSPSECGAASALERDRHALSCSRRPVDLYPPGRLWGKDSSNGWVRERGNPSTDTGARPLLPERDSAGGTPISRLEGGRGFLRC
jgi:hypothetical protein